MITGSSFPFMISREDLPRAHTGGVAALHSRLSSASLLDFGLRATVRQGQTVEDFKVKTFQGRDSWTSQVSLAVSFVIPTHPHPGVTSPAGQGLHGIRETLASDLLSLYAMGLSHCG